MAIVNGKTNGLGYHGVPMGTQMRGLRRLLRRHRHPLRQCLQLPRCQWCRWVQPRQLPSWSRRDCQFGTWSVGILMVLLWNYNWSTHTMFFFMVLKPYIWPFFFLLFMFFSGWHPKNPNASLFFYGMKIRDYHQWNDLRVKFTKPILFYKKCNLLLHIVIYGDGSKPWYLVNPKIAGKWMFIPLKMYL